MTPIKRTYLVEFKNTKKAPNELLSFVLSATRPQLVVDYVRKQGEGIEVVGVYVKVENWK